MTVSGQSAEPVIPPEGRPVPHTVAVSGKDDQGLEELTREVRRLRRVLAASRISGDAHDEAAAVRRIADDLDARGVPLDPAAYPQWGAGEHIMSNPVVGRRSVIAPPLEMLQLPDGSVAAEVTLDLDYEGPPGCVHGGVIAMLFDELLGTANARSGHAAMTVDLRTSYHSPTPVRTPLRLTGRVDRTEGRKVWTVAELHAGDRLCATGEGLFVIPKFLVENTNGHHAGTIPGSTDEKGSDV